jgi:hypothetical protein
MCGSTLQFAYPLRSVKPAHRHEPKRRWAHLGTESLNASSKGLDSDGLCPKDERRTIGELVRGARDITLPDGRPGAGKVDRIDGRAFGLLSCSQSFRGEWRTIDVGVRRSLRRRRRDRRLRLML